MLPSTSGLSRRPFTAESGVRIPLGVPSILIRIMPLSWCNPQLDTHTLIKLAFSDVNFPRVRMWLRKDAIICLSSSVGKSARLISGRSKVRILPSVPVASVMIFIPNNQSDVLLGRGCKLERIIVTAMPWVSVCPFLHFLSCGPEHCPQKLLLLSRGRAVGSSLGS